MTDTAAQGAPRPAPADPAAPETQMKASMRYLRRHLREFGILFALIVIMAFFQVATQRRTQLDD